MGLFSKSFNAAMTKAHLKMAVTRIGIARSSTQNTMLNIKLKIAELLKEGKEEKARIKAEQLIQEEKMELAYDLIETMCELLVTRIAYIDSMKLPPNDLLGPIHSIIYAADRIDVKELVEAREQFKHKYGKEFVIDASLNKYQEVHFKLVKLLSIEPPHMGELYLVLKKISDQYNVPFEAENNVDGTPPPQFLPGAPPPPQPLMGGNLDFHVPASILPVNQNQFSSTSPANDPNFWTSKELSPSTKVESTGELDLPDVPVPQNKNNDSVDDLMRRLNNL